MATRKMPKSTGRPKDTPEQKAIKNILKRIKKSNEEDINAESLSMNELLYQFNKYGLSPNAMIKLDAMSEETSGFGRVILTLFAQAMQGELEAIEMILNISGLHKNRVDHTSSDGSANKVITLAYNLDE